MTSSWSLCQTMTTVMESNAWKSVNEGVNPGYFLHSTVMKLLVAVKHMSDVNVESMWTDQLPKISNSCYCTQNYGFFFIKTVSLMLIFYPVDSVLTVKRITNSSTATSLKLSRNKCLVRWLKVFCLCRTKHTPADRRDMHATRSWLRVIGIPSGPTDFHLFGPLRSQNSNSDDFNVTTDRSTLGTLCLKIRS